MCTATKGYGQKPPSPIIYGFSSTTPAAANDPNRIVSVNNPNPDTMYTPGKMINKGATLTTAGGQTLDAAEALSKQQIDSFGSVIAGPRSAQLNDYVGLSLSPAATGVTPPPVAQDDPASTVQTGTPKKSAGTDPAVTVKQAAPVSEQLSYMRRPAMTRDKLRQRFGINTLVTAGVTGAGSTASKQLYGQ